MARKPVVAVWLSSLLLLAGVVAAAEDLEFRVDSEVFFGSEKEPFETLTIFTEGRVYDFVLAEPREITVFDPGHGRDSGPGRDSGQGRFIVLNEAQSVKSVITTQDLMAFTLELETQAAREKNALLAFAARPQFETTAENITENGETLVKLKLAGNPLEYVVLGQTPKHEQAAVIYRNFADWYARLNATRSLNLPAGARLALNQELAERQLLPREITRTISPPNRLGKKLEVKSRHLVNWTLSARDRKEIERVGNCIATFRPISYDEYRKGAVKVAAGRK